MSEAHKIYKSHPIAAIFPMIESDAFEKLKADIQQNGIKEFGLLYEGKILDGRNRYKAARELGIEMTWQEVELGDPEDTEAFDPVSHVLSQNLHRRHLKQSQRALIAANLATLSHGQRKSDRSNDLSQDDASELLSVSTPQVKRAKHVIEHGSKDLLDAVESCEIAVSMAEKLCKAVPDKREQSALVKQGKQSIRDAIKPPAPRPTPTPSSSDGPGDEFDFPVVKAFRHADYRLETLKRIFAELEPHERRVAAEWLEGSR